ncbi:MAG TPA: glycosyltransferase family 2 protein [Thermomicrobiales bacterium]|nr:glycosyltransferase family 2 protein [Thermomicrobiales bacterium]
MAELSVAIVSYNTRDLLRRCLDSLLAATAGLQVEAIVVDNGSTDGSQAMLAGYSPAVTLIENGANLGFAAANNVALAHATAPATLLLNSDAFVTTADVEQALALLRDHPQIGMVGVRLLNIDGTVQAEAGTFPTFWEDVKTSVGIDQLGRRRRQASAVPGAVDWVQGACMFVRTEAVKNVGGLDERFFMYSEEVDWCRRFWLAGWEVWYLPDANVVHIGGASSRSDTRRRLALYTSRLGFRRRASGPGSSLLLWLLMLAGLAARVVIRPLAQLAFRRRVGNQTAAADTALIAGLLRVDPLARWASS